MEVKEGRREGVGEARGKEGRGVRGMQWSARGGEMKEGGKGVTNRWMIKRMTGKKQK